MGHFVNHLVETAGIPLLFALIMVESAGIPLPGETALITAAILASQGKLDIVEVVIAAAAAAIIGDNIGYWVARRWGRRILQRWPRVRRFADRTLPRAERFFARHGDKTIFIGRFIAVLRIWAAWLAGLSHMPWWRFLFWNAAGGIAWAVTVSLVAYSSGEAAAEAINRYGLYAGGAIVGGFVLVVAGLHVWKRRMEERVK